MGRLKNTDNVSITLQKFISLNKFPHLHIILIWTVRFGRVAHILDQMQHFAYFNMKFVFLCTNINFTSDWVTLLLSVE